MSPYNPNERIELRASTEELAQWREYAERESMTLSAWIRRACHDHMKTLPSAELVATVAKLKADRKAGKKPGH